MATKSFTQKTVASKAVDLVHGSEKDPVTVGLLAQSQVLITPLSSGFASVNGEQFIFHAGVSETVPQVIADQLKRAGKI